MHRFRTKKGKKHKISRLVEVRGARDCVFLGFLRKKLVSSNIRHIDVCDVQMDSWQISGFVGRGPQAGSGLIFFPFGATPNFPPFRPNTFKNWAILLNLVLLLFLFGINHPFLLFFFVAQYGEPKWVRSNHVTHAVCKVGGGRFPRRWKRPWMKSTKRKREIQSRAQEKEIETSFLEAVMGRPLLPFLYGGASRGQQWQGENEEGKFYCFFYISSRAISAKILKQEFKKNI